MTVTPWYIHEDCGTQSHKRLLLISYHFPPDAAVGARRWEKLASYAAERGWGLDVITREMPTRDTDAARLRTLPSGVRIYRIPIEPIGVQRFENRVDQIVRRLRDGQSPTASAGVETQGASDRTAQPASATDGAVVSSSKASPKASPRPSSLNREEVRWQLGVRPLLRAYWATIEYAQYFSWVERAASLAVSLTTPGTHLAIVSSGPPHMMHEAARRASVLTGVPFVMDMRDPWSLNEQIIEHIASPVWYQFAQYYESRAVDQSMLVVANTELARQALQAAYPAKRSDVVTIMNGADEDPLPPSRKGGRFVIAHAGTLYLDRDPRALFEAAARVIRELQLTPEQFGLEFIGLFDTVGGYPIHDVVRQVGIERYVSIGASLPYAQAMEFMANATMLVTMSGSNVMAIPAKTFECVRFEAWLLAISAPGSATELLLRDTSADVVAPGDVESITAAIMKRYQQHAAGVTPPRLGDDPRFSRRGQATLLFDAIEERRRA